eukprot:6721924-Prymnesium_polylepis.1
MSQALNLPVLLGVGTGATNFKHQLTDAASPLAAIALPLEDVLSVLDHQLGLPGVSVPLPDDTKRVVRGLVG